MDGLRTVSHISPFKIDSLLARELVTEKNFVDARAWHKKTEDRI
jgi:hypothetical protein